MRRRWFASWNDARQFAARHDLQATPVKREVWLDYAWREEWCLELADESDAAADGGTRAEGTGEAV